jgi:hypothetical protein
MALRARPISPPQSMQIAVTAVADARERRLDSLQFLTFANHSP